MKKNLKYHLKAIGAISGIILIIYLVVGTPKPTASVAPTGNSDRFIQIDSATFGLSCNTDIQRQMKKRQVTPLQKEKPEDLAAIGTLQPVSPNNVLPFLSKMCDGQLTCSTPVDVTSLQLEDPFISCFKRLSVSYRCFSYDRLWTLEIGQGETMTIDCNEKTEDTSAPTDEAAPAAQ